MADSTVHNLNQISSGVATSTDEVAIWDTSAAASKRILLSDLWAVIKPPTAVFQNYKFTGVPGGTATSGAWYIVQMTKEEDPNYIINNYSNHFFEIGTGFSSTSTYRIEAFCPFYDCNRAQVRLFNVTDGIVQKNINNYDILGETINCNTTGNVNESSWLIGTFTITGYKDLRIEYRVSTTKADSGLGVADTWGYGIFALIQITRL